MAEVSAVFDSFCLGSGDFSFGLIVPGSSCSSSTSDIKSRKLGSGIRQREGPREFLSGVRKESLAAEKLGERGEGSSWRRGSVARSESESFESLVASLKTQIRHLKLFFEHAEL